MFYVLTKHVDGKAGIMGNKRSNRIIMTDEARVLKELRISRGLSMRKAGELMGVSDSYISHIENGRLDVPKGKRLEKILLIYKINHF